MLRHAFLLFCFFTLVTFPSTVSSQRRERNKIRKSRRAGRFQRGGKMWLCPDDDSTEGECTGRLIKIHMEKLAEIDTAGALVQKSENFKTADFEWVAPQEITDDAGIVRTETSFTATVDVGPPSANNAPATFTMVASIYRGNGTVVNADQTLEVQEGSMKFTITVENWPFQATTNSLTFGVNMVIKDRSGNDGTLEKVEDGAAEDTTAPQVERYTLGDGMFLDSPERCVIDGANADVTSTSRVTEGVMELDWVFPHFTTSMVYDPIIGAAETEDTTSNGSDSGANLARRQFFINAVLMAMALFISMFVLH